MLQADRCPFCYRREGAIGKARSIGCMVRSYLPTVAARRSVGINTSSSSPVVPLSVEEFFFFSLDQPNHIVNAGGEADGDGGLIHTCTRMNDQCTVLTVLTVLTVHTTSALYPPQQTALKPLASVTPRLS